MSEITDYQDADRSLTETIHRVVEFGRAYHVATLVEALPDLGVTGAVVSDARVQIPALEG